MTDAINSFEKVIDANAVAGLHSNNTHTGPVVYRYFYNDSGSRIEKRDGSDTVLQTCAYDQKNRITRLVDQSGTLTFSYDPNDYRIEKDNSGQTSKYFLEGEHYEAIYDENNSLKARFLRGVIVDEIVYGYLTDQSRETPYTFHHDHLNSVTGLSGHNGDELETISFSPFGQEISYTGSSSNTLKYTGRENDVETGLYYYRARYYDPEIGRFLNEDPLGFEAGVNFYAYVHNNPVNFNDPDGLKTIVSIGYTKVPLPGKLYHQFLKLMPNDLILLDRDYPAYWIFNLIISQGADFCARIQRKRWKVVRQFYNSGKKEKIISLPVFPSSVRHCKEMGLELCPLKLRLIRVELDTGEAEILITSLLDSKKHPHQQFAELYHLRWPVEEDYKTMKQWIEVKNFSGKSVLSVYQDFHAKVFSKNLVSALIYPTQPQIDESMANSPYRYKPNFAQVISKMKDVVPLLFIRSQKELYSLIADIHAIVVKTIEPIRPGRKYPRTFNNRGGRFHYGYQPTR